MIPFLLAIFLFVLFFLSIIVPNSSLWDRYIKNKQESVFYIVIAVAFVVCLYCTFCAMFDFV